MSAFMEANLDTKKPDWFIAEQRMKRTANNVNPFSCSCTPEANISPQVQVVNKRNISDAFLLKSDVYLRLGREPDLFKSDTTLANLGFRV